MAPKLRSIIERFWNKVEYTPGCWNWLASLDKDGYGKLRVTPTKCERAHRISYRQHFGEFNEDLLVCHKCDNPTCVNPDHLFLGTTQDNTKDRNNKNRQAKGEAISGNRDNASGTRHGSRTKPEKVPRKEANGNSKLTTDKIIKIRDLLTNGISQTRIAQQFGVSQTTISCVFRGKTWN
jgi:hypothetical protein